MHPLEFLAEAKKGLQSFTAQKLVLQIFFQKQATIRRL